MAVGTRPTLGNTGMPLAGYAGIQSSVMAIALGTPGAAASNACPSGPAATCNTAILEQPGTYDQLNAVTCPAVDDCIAVGDRGTIVRTGAAFPAPSSSAWTANLRDSSITWSVADGNADASLYGISCASSTDCASVGGGNTQLATSDAVSAATGPSPWTALSVPKPPVLASQANQTTNPGPPPPTDAGARLTSVSCPAAGQCLAVGTTGWIATLAAGTWTSRLVDPTGQKTVPTGQTQGVVPTEDLHAVSCAPATALAGDTCVAVGDHGAVLTTTDGGATWAVTGNGTTPFTTATLDGVACPSAGSCVAVGAGGTVLALAYSGGLWSATPVPSATTALLSAVSCPAPTSCVAVGTNGAVLTLSGDVTALSATTRSSGVGDDLYGVSCPSTTICAAAGSNGTVITTVNSALAWTAIGTGTDVTFRSVSCPTVMSCYAAGDSGAVLSVTPPVAGTLHAALSLSPTQVSTDGGTTTATVTVTNNGAPDPNATVSLTRTGTGTIGSLTNNGDGTYSAQLTASPRVGVETVTAQATDGALSATATAPLTDTLGVPATITLTVDPGSIQADGVTTARATATVTDAHQNVVPGETVAFGSDGDVSVSPASATTDASGVAVATITASKTVGKQSISATDSAHGLTTSQPLTLVQTFVAPTNVTASPADDQAIVSWTSATPPSGDTLTDYVVTPSPAGSQGPVKVPAGTTSTNVPGLTNGTAYTFTVTAEFGSGKTATSSPSNSVIPFGEPSVPKPVTAVAGDTTATVTWGKSDDNGSPIRRYTVTASPGGATIVASPDQTTAHFTGLTNGTSYTFTVTAQNAAEAVTSAPSAAVVPKYGTALQVAAAQVAIIAGQTGTVHGTLTRDGLPLRGAHVTITVRPAGATSYSALATVVTGGFGQWSIPVRPTRNSTYRIGFAGDPADRPAAAATSLPVHAQVRLSSPRNGTTLPRGYLTLTATSRYAVPGTSAWLQFRRADGTWAPLAFARVGRDGGLRWVASLGRGTHWLRLYVASTATNAAASTKPFVLYAT
ncbi:MAG: fibronectin type III domain-containing protein [Frankiaceae bacterium]|nr:fibronectin type III domain-containing protein [Frankiaceae bacterium]